ncbi:unnamed protein product [Peniophora sp. CBMAI 1063]|nr:unnamed protein product [Peniophora sp. CBMAI 1063]
MGAVDPTYPLYPAACILASCMLLLVLFTNFVRQSWNLGVAFLCFWLFLETLTDGVDAIVWSDNANIKHYVYCDIVSHLQLIAFTVKPLATLIITRRLYLIAYLQPVESLNKEARRKDLAIEWTLGLVIPLLVAGPLYYVVQDCRFAVIEGFGCRNNIDGSILSIILVYSWSVIPPTISVAVYYSHIALTFYRHNRDLNRLLQNDEFTVSRTTYLRILALASIDLLLTLPIGIATIVLTIKESLYHGSLPFYSGWEHDHAQWEPQGTSYTDIASEQTSIRAANYFTMWTSPVLAFVIFSLFGVTSEARASYWRIICAVGERLGWKPTPRAPGTREQLGDIEFGPRSTQELTSSSFELPPSSVESKACLPERVIDIQELCDDEKAESVKLEKGVDSPP